MAAELLLVGNPARRKSRKARSPAQKAATRRMLAANRSKRAGGTKRRKTRRAPALAAVRSNPIRRTSKRRAVRHSRRARRNPININTRSIVNQLKEAGIGALGAFGVDVAYGFGKAYLPAAVASPSDASGGINYLYYAAKGAAAIGIGMVAGKFLGAARTAQVVNGSLTVTAHDLIKQFAATSLTSVPMGYSPGARVLPPLPGSQSLRGIGLSRSGATSLPQDPRVMNSGLRMYPKMGMYPRVA